MAGADQAPRHSLVLPPPRSSWPSPLPHHREFGSGAGGWLSEAGEFGHDPFLPAHTLGSTRWEGGGAWREPLLLGPRLGKYVDGASRPFFGHRHAAGGDRGVSCCWLGVVRLQRGVGLPLRPIPPGLTGAGHLPPLPPSARGPRRHGWRHGGPRRSPHLSMVLNGVWPDWWGSPPGADLMTVMDAVWVGRNRRGPGGGLHHTLWTGSAPTTRWRPSGCTWCVGDLGHPGVGLFGSSAGIGGMWGRSSWAWPPWGPSPSLAMAAFLAIRASDGLRSPAEEELGGLDVCS